MNVLSQDMAETTAIRVFLFLVFFYSLSLPAYQLNEGLTSHYLEKYILNPVGEGMHNLEPGCEIL